MALLVGPGRPATIRRPSGLLERGVKVEDHANEDDEEDHAEDDTDDDAGTLVVVATVELVGGAPWLADRLITDKGHDVGACGDLRVGQASSRSSSGSSIRGALGVAVLRHADGCHSRCVFLPAS